jgi:hypothetical protein
VHEFTSSLSFNFNKNLDSVLHPIDFERMTRLSDCLYGIVQFASIRPMSNIHFFTIVAPQTPENRTNFRFNRISRELVAHTCHPSYSDSQDRVLKMPNTKMVW